MAKQRWCFNVRDKIEFQVGGCNLVLTLLLVLPIGVEASAGISSLPKTVRPQYVQNLTNHVIRADRDGFAVRTDVDEETLFPTTNSFQTYVGQILDRAEGWSLTRRPEQKSAKPVVRILVHVHGGLNDWSTTVERVALVDAMANETNPADQYYPIFVSWPAGYWNSYCEHAYRLRQGNRVGKLSSVLTTPAIVTTDLAKGLVSMPVAWFYQISNSKDRLLYQSGEDGLGQYLSRNYKMAIINSKRPEVTNAYTLLTGDAASSTEELILKRYGIGLVTTPFRMTIGTLGEGQTTASAWQVMKRRTSNLFYPPDQYELLDEGRLGLSLLSSHCAAGEFFRLLIKRVIDYTNYQYQITFVGHSMGTIVLNHLFSAYRQDWVRSQAIENIIYMGAACSVWEGIQAITPLLQGCQDKDGNCQGAKFYNLTLHPLAEISEEMFRLAVPAGSLLHLIDTHLENPNGPLDRTLGSQVNVISGIEAFREIRQCCVFKGFDFIPGRIPAAHGDFSRCPFWRQEFREPIKPRAIPEDQSRRLIHGKRTSRQNANASGERVTSTFPDTTNWVEKASINTVNRSK